jgi:phytoene dehydrogenase-like protein
MAASRNGVQAGAFAAKEAEYQRLQEELTAVRRELDHLGPRMRYAQAEESVTRGVQHHDNQCQAMGEAARKVGEQWQAFVMACRQFVQTRDEQIRGLFLPDATGAMAWKLVNGTAALERMLAALPEQPATLTDSVLHALREPPTTEELHRAIATTPGRAPFPPERVAQYLATYEPSSIQGTDHGDR